jgi:hypothetical protein
MGEEKEKKNHRTSGGGSYRWGRHTNTKGKYDDKKKGSRHISSSAGKVVCTGFSIFFSGGLMYTSRSTDGLNGGRDTFEPNWAVLLRGP